MQCPGIWFYRNSDHAFVYSINMSTVIPISLHTHTWTRIEVSSCTPALNHSTGSFKIKQPASSRAVQIQSATASVTCKNRSMCQRWCLASISNIDHRWEMGEGDFAYRTFWCWLFSRRSHAKDINYRMCEGVRTTRPVGILHSIENDLLATDYY